MKLKIEIDMKGNDLMADYADLSACMQSLMRAFNNMHRDGEVCDLGDGDRVWDSQHISRVGYWHIYE